MNKPVIVIAIIVVLGIGAYLFINANEKGNPSINSGDKDATGTGQGETQGALVVENQKAGTLAVIKKAELPAPGFVVIYRDAGERPGGIIAQSELLPKGTYKNIEIKTEVYPTEKDKSYFVMLNLDDGDEEFNAGKDMPTPNESGGSYMVTFKAL
ncbi:MAG: hypothetical protein Q8P17_04625 [bacterium]|nr:hypothetical protein [bacterium]